MFIQKIYYSNEIKLRQYTPPTMKNGHQNDNGKLLDKSGARLMNLNAIQLNAHE